MTPESDGQREFEVSVKRKQDHEDDQHGQRTNEFHLMLGLKQLAILPAPVEPISGRQGFCNVRDRSLAGEHGALQVAPFDAVLHADIPRVVFAIDERSAAGLMNVGKLAQRNLLA